MSDPSPQRFLANNRNLFATATLTPSSVLPVANQVKRLDYARSGTAQAVITGDYTGVEQADIDIEIVDDTVEDARVSTPTFAGAGSGTIEDISASGTQQTFTIECSNAGIVGQQASVTVEGVSIKALEEGTAGNSIRLSVDQSGLTYTESTYTTLVDLDAGQGGQNSALIGAGFDWATVALDVGTGLIPTNAQRVAFGDDPTVYLNYRDFVDGAWNYYLVPALQNAVPKGTIVKVVTGGRTVTITDGSTTEISTAQVPAGIVTAFDLLNWIRTNSTLAYVDGIVANDRTPTGQASRELSLRTDAHAQVSSGSSQYATGFTNVSVAADAGTQLVTAECIGVTSSDHVNARLGHTLWALKSSLLGTLGTIAEGEPFSGAQFGLTIPVKLPPDYGESKGTIGAYVTYTSRAIDEEEPPICVVGLALGPDATDKTVTFRYAARPTGDCVCDGMQIPAVNPNCLGTPGEGGASVSYQDDTNVRLIALRAYIIELVNKMSDFGTGTNLSSTTPSTAFGNSAVEAPAISNPADGTAVGVTIPITGTAIVYAQQTLSIKAVANEFEATIAQIDPLPVSASPPGYREAGMDAWDDAFQKFQDDIDATIGASSPPNYWLVNIPSGRYTAYLEWALASAGIANVGGADASTVSGDGCWRDIGDAAWWEDVDGVYMPLFTNNRWYFSRKTADGSIVSTHEATGIINVKCPEDLKYGDEITIKILNAGYGTTYNVGDTIELPIIAAADLYLSGGVTGAPIQTWNVSGSVSGGLTSYTFDPDTPVAYEYDTGGVTLSFLLAQGGIPFAKGDRFRLAIEGGHYRWRYVGGAWEATRPIPITSDELDDGLSVSFTAGAAASFVVDDVYKFRALQPWAVSNVQTPNQRVWKWDNSASPATHTLDADFGTTQTIDMFAMLHGIEDEDAVITLSGGVATATEWSESIPWREFAVWKEIARTARYVRITIESEESGSVQWPWAGEALTTELSADFDPILDFQISRPGGNLRGGRFVGETISGDVTWSHNALTESDVGYRVAADGLVAMVKEIKRAGDAPLIFVPNVTQVDDPIVFARVAADRIQLPGRLTSNYTAARRFAASLPLEGVYR